MPSRDDSRRAGGRHECFSTPRAAGDPSWSPPIFRRYAPPAPVRLIATVAAAAGDQGADPGATCGIRRAAGGDPAECGVGRTACDNSRCGAHGDPANPGHRGPTARHAGCRGRARSRPSRDRSARLRERRGPGRGSPPPASTCPSSFASRVAFLPSKRENQGGAVAAPGRIADTPRRIGRRSVSNSRGATEDVFRSGRGNEVLLGGDASARRARSTQVRAVPCHEGIERLADRRPIGVPAPFTAAARVARHTRNNERDCRHGHPGCPSAQAHNSHGS